ncbi:MAG: hypothetical protein IJT59_08120 [Desulfovibrionaceae bacterium]|nr:hypothetical protein [Desulfovibrionaceae bacterium]
MRGIDIELEKFLRVMLNADRPPTNEWINNFLLNFPWVNGLAGVKYDGTILGQAPETALKELDYIPLLYEDKKQKRTALRADVQNTPLGPEVMLAAPLYESTDFLGIVVAHFDMRSLASFSESPERLVILSPQALLWPGEYDFAKTPLAGQDWEKICRESSQGKCENSIGKFIYQVRYLGNVPLVFAVAESDNFPKGNGQVEQGKPFFPEKREKLPPPPQPERKKDADKGIPVFAKPEPEPEAVAPETPPTPTPEEQEMERAKIKRQMAKEEARKRQRAIQQMRARERELQRLLTPPPPPKPVKVTPDLNVPTEQGPTLPGGRPSPFSQSAPKPSGESSATPSPTPSKTTAPSELPGGRPSPFGNNVETKSQPKAGSAPQSPPKTEEKPATLPGGRPSPFGS